jgi:hypothetical protein
MTETLAPAAEQALAPTPTSTVTITQVLTNQQGPLTTQGTFVSQGGVLYMTVSGSAWSSNAAATISVVVSVDGEQVGTAQVFTNESQSHKALIPLSLQLPQLAAGVHTVSLAAGAGTTTDLNDFFDVTVTEFVPSSVSITGVYVNAAGALPLAGDTFTSHGGTLTLNASGSAWSTSAGALIGMNVLVDGVVVGTSQVYTNEAQSHKALIPISVALPGVGAGAHVVVIQPLSGTTTDFNDFFNVTVVEVDND